MPGGLEIGIKTQRRLEVLVAKLDEEPSEKPLGVVRRLYEDVCHRMAEGFTKALVKGHWTVPATLHQTKIFSEVGIKLEGASGVVVDITDVAHRRPGRKPT